MKSILSLLLILALTSLLNAQGVGFTLKSGKVLRDKVTERTVAITDLGVINGQAYFLYHPFSAVFSEKSIGTTESFFVGKFDKELNLIKRAELVLKHDKKELSCEAVLKLKDKFLVFSSFQNSKDKKHYLFVQDLNSETLELLPNIKLVAELDYSGFSKYNSTVFDYEFSPDSSKIMIFYTLRSKQNEALRKGIYVFDQNMNLKWKKSDIVAKFKGGVFDYSRFRIDNEGNVYLLGLHFKDKENYYDAAHFSDRGFFSKDTYYTDKPNYTHQLYRYSEAGNREDLYELSLPGKFIRSLNFLPVDGNSVICSGMYGSEGKISVEGAFAFTYDMSAKMVNGLSTKELGKDLISQGFDPNELRRFKRSIDNKQEWDPFAYFLSGIQNRQNGDKYFIAEQYISGTKTERSGNVIVYSAIHMRNDLFVVSLDNNYQITRIDKIHKRQYWLNSDEYNSYACTEKNGNLYFIYNTFESVDGMFKNIEMGDSFITRLDAKGKTQSTIFRKKEAMGEPLPMPMTAILMPDQSLIFSLMTFNWKDYQVQEMRITE